jgi:predicted lipoprotein with Yx(FWY)xxD motif
MQVILVAQNPALGSLLTDTKGMTLYLFTKDAPGVTNCYDQCATSWPPLLVPDDTTPTAGSGFSGKLGTIERKDGTYQVTVNDMPVYYFAKDKAAGDVTGQNVGKVWFVLDPAGNKVATVLATATAAPASVMVAKNTALGSILTDSKGMTLYIYTKDTAGVSNCSGDCAGIWPPLTVPQGSTPTAGDGFTGKLGTIQRADGTTQVTVNDMPVYLWVKDKAPGDVTGQNVGKVWFVLDAAGNINNTVLATATPAAAGPVIMATDNPTLGKILTDGKGMTLYLFTKDTPGVSNCADKCATAWPPLLVPQGVSATAGDGFTGTLGTIQRADGTIQVTVNNMPVYYYAKDTKAGDTTGQKVGGVWFVLDAAGMMVEK